MSGKDKREKGRDAAAIHRNILDNIASGVISIDSAGVVTTFNTAASEIIGLPEEEVVGREFSKVFLIAEGLEEFTETILDAVSSGSVVRQHVVAATLAGRQRFLSVSSSYLKETRDGEVVRLGLVAVFDDISEVRALQEAERELAKELETKHGELQGAYRDLEEKNQDLSATMKKAQMAQIGAVSLAVLLFGSVGLYIWNTGPQVEEAASFDHEEFSADGELATLVVEPQSVSSTLVVASQLMPRQEIGVTSPMTGKVAAVHVQHGEQVAKGQLLVNLDVSEIWIKHREAKAVHIKTLERFNELEDWSNSVDVSRARRALSKAASQLESRRSKFEEATFLLERGIIPASEHEAAEREYRNQQLDFRSAEQELDIVLAKGTADRRVAKLELEIAQARLDELQEILTKASVRAPVAGVVMHPKGAADGFGLALLEPGLVQGASVTQGERLLTLGDLSGFSVVGKVDEVEITKINLGDSVRIVGDAFPGIELHGTIVHVSSQARQEMNRRKPPYFEIIAVVEDLDANRRQALRLGMSANLEILLYERDDALLVPINAVIFSENRPWLGIRDPDTREVRRVPVATGVTTVDSVEIVDGIVAGDEIVVPGR